MMTLLLLTTLLQNLHPTHSHGYLTTPRSRNLVAHQDSTYNNPSSSHPLPEDCPTCLNRGGSLAQCGISSGVRNYDLPQNALGDSMMANPQMIWSQGDQVEVMVTLTAHHKGHFVFSGCPIANTTTVPTAECFESHRLTLVRDVYYGAPIDPSHPERVYVAPSTIKSRVYPDVTSEYRDAMLFSYVLQLPPDLVGELVLIQWYYVASNSGCVHEGYAEYDFPREWIVSLDEEGGGKVEEPSDWEVKWGVGTGLKSCEEVLPEDGDGVPEQFWNCAEVTIVPRSLQDDTTDAITASASSNSKKHSKAILGYYASWQWYDRMKLASPENMDFSKVTRVNFAFFQTNEQGDIWGTDSWADPNLLFGPYDWNAPENATEYCSWDTPTGKVCKNHFYEQGLIYQVHAAGAEIYPSLGGWSLSDPFPAMAANEESRLNFANNCIKLVEEMDFDGIDIDWEYPGYVDHSGTPEDTESYNLLLQLLREKLDELGTRNNRFYGLTAALPCGPDNINNIDIVTASKYLTELNLMTYDFFGGWSPTTGVNAPLYDQDWGGEGAKDFSVDGCVRNWVKGGGSPAAINIGLPFYGRSFANAKGLNETHKGTDKNNWYIDDGSPQYFNILEKLPGMVSVRNEITKTQYAYLNTTMGGMVSYDDEEAICDKTEYCLENELHGFIIWELSGDVMKDLSTPLLDAVHRKLDDPSLSCKDEFGFDSPTFTGYGIGPDTAITNEPGQAPVTTTTSPTVPLKCPEGFTGSLPYDVCHSFYTCVFGTPVYPVTTCPDHTLFDERSSLCLPSSGVECSLTRSPTTAPTIKPTDDPTVYIEPDTSRGSITGISNVPPATETYTPMTNMDTASPTMKITTTSPVFNVFLPQNDLNEAEAIETDQDDFVSGYADQNEAGATSSEQSDATTSYCPNNFSGAMPYNGCTEYYYCLYGEPSFPAVKCPPGKVFMEQLSFDDLILCKPIESSQRKCAATSIDLGMANSQSSNDDSLEGGEVNVLDEGNKTGDEEKNSALSNTPSKIEEESAEDTNQHRSPCKTCSDSYTGYVASSTDCVTYCLCQNGTLNEILYACPSNWLFDSESGRCLPSKLVTCETVDQSLSSTVDEEVIFIPLDDSNGIGASKDGTNDPKDDQIQKHEPPSFSINGPFLTIELKLGDDPRGIGWSAVSSDGQLSISKPPGTYSSYKPTTTVYEAVPVQLREKRRLIANKDSIQGQLTLRLENTFGVGLCCSGKKKGYYKVYNGNPQRTNLLISGGEFKYYDVVLLILDEDDTLHESNAYFAELEQLSLETNNTESDSQSVEDAYDFSLVSNEDETSLPQTNNATIEEKESGASLNSFESSSDQIQHQNESEELGRESNMSTDATSLDTSTEESVIYIDDNNNEIMLPDVSKPFGRGPEQELEERPPHTEASPDSKTEVHEHLNKGFEFDYTANDFQTKREPPSTKQNHSLKPIIIGSILIFVALGVAVIFIAKRRKTSHNDIMYYEDDNGSSVCSDNFFDNFLSSREINVEPSYRVRPIRRGSSTSNVNNQSDDQGMSRRPSFSEEQYSLDKDLESIMSNHSVNRERSSNAHYHHIGRKKSSHSDHKAVNRRTSNEISGNGSYVRRNSEEICHNKYDIEQNYQKSRSNGSAQSHLAAESNDIRPNFQRSNSNGSTASHPTLKNINIESNGMAQNYHRSKSSDSATCNPLERKNIHHSSATSNPFDSNEHDHFDQDGIGARETEMSLHDNNTADDASEGIETLVQMHINDAISLFDDGSSNPQQVNSILQKFDQEIEEDGVLT